MGWILSEILWKSRINVILWRVKFARRVNQKMMRNNYSTLPCCSILSLLGSVQEMKATANQFPGCGAESVSRCVTPSDLNCRSSISNLKVQIVDFPLNSFLRGKLLHKIDWLNWCAPCSKTHKIIKLKKPIVIKLRLTHSSIQQRNSRMCFREI